MATYAIGDVQGCYAELEALLERIEFSASRDCLWFVGDLVNRGPRSLAVLRYVASLDGAARVVLGNHDLHLLATSKGIRKFKSRDTFDDVLLASDRDYLLDWLRRQPLLHHDADLDFTMVHAGLAPQWDHALASACAEELSETVKSERWVTFFEHMYGDSPAQWSEDLTGWKRLRFITNALTRLRYCKSDGTLALDVTETPAPRRARVTPWFAMPERKSAGSRIVFGHWATLQLEEPLDPAHGVFHVDLGCVWGGKLTALRLEDLTYYHVHARPKR